MIRSPVLLAATLSWLVACSETAPPQAARPTEIPSPAGPGSQVPRLTKAADGDVWMSWLEAAEGDEQALTAARLGEDGWSDPITIARGSDWFVNRADFPSLIVGADGAMAAHWLAMTPGGTYAYDVVMSVSGDGGDSWSEPFSPHDDGTLTEHGFVSLFLLDDGLAAIWLDGREMAQEGQPDPGHGHGSGGMTLRGAVMNREGRILQSDLLDDLTCDCCQTGAAVTAAGPIAVYRNRTGREVRDVYYSLFRDGRWTPGRPVADDGWEISACPVNGPAIDARGPYAVVGWFTGAPEPAVRAAFWSDAAGEFTEAVDISRDRPLGRVDSALLPDGSAVVVWLAATEVDAGEIRYRRVWPDGRQGPVTVVGETGSARLSGFPQMVAAGGSLVFAWTLPGDPSVVRTAIVAIGGAGGA
jgi:hypothetical protein